MKHFLSVVLAAALLSQVVHCSGTSSSDTTEPGPSPDTDGGTTPVTPSRDSSVPTGDSAPPADGSVATGDPALDGPYTIKEIDVATNKVTATTDNVPIHCAYPTAGPTAGPYPVVVLGHGFLLSSDLYYGYVKRLATWGYVALTADYPANFLSKSNLRDAANLSGGLDWALAATELTGKVDATKVGVMGHSRGGKAAVLAAVKDKRFKAVLGLDPVDGVSPLGCNATTECPDASDAMATIGIPSAFLGETLDATGSLQACAPAADNYTTFYASAPSKSLQVTINGASHLSFLDDPSACTGLACNQCNTPTATQADVFGITHAMTVAFFEKTLRGNAAMDAYLTGALAQSRYVTTNRATIVSK